MSSRTATILQEPASVSIRSSLETCQQCGADLSHSHSGLAEDAQRRIAELEAQVKILTNKATAAGKSKFKTQDALHLSKLGINRAMHLLIYNLNYIIVDKLADYEDELRELKQTDRRTSPAVDRKNNGSPNPDRQPEPRPSSATNNRNPIQSRFSYLLPASRRSLSQPPSSAPATQSTHNALPSDSADLLNLLTREQSLRQAAESRVNQTNEEVEDLTAQLFTEANEMVAAERKERAKLEQRVMVLERRDGEKRARLEVLEGRLARIERVREMLKNGGS